MPTVKISVSDLPEDKGVECFAYCVTDNPEGVRKSLHYITDNTLEISDANLKNHELKLKLKLVGIHKEKDQ